MRTCIGFAVFVLVGGNALADCPEPTSSELAVAINEQIDQHEDISVFTKGLYTRSENQGLPYVTLTFDRNVSKFAMYTVRALEDMGIVTTSNVSYDRFKLNMGKAPPNFAFDFDQGSGSLRIRGASSRIVEQINKFDVFKVGGETIAVIDARMKFTPTSELQSIFSLVYKFAKADGALPKCYPKDGRMDGYRREKLSLLQDATCNWLWQLSDYSYSGDTPLCSDLVLIDIDLTYREQKQFPAGVRGDLGRKPFQAKLPTSERLDTEIGTDQNNKKQFYSRLPLGK